MDMESSNPCTEGWVIWRQGSLLSLLAGKGFRKFLNSGPGIGFLKDLKVTDNITQKIKNSSKFLMFHGMVRSLARRRGSCLPVFALEEFHCWHFHCTFVEHTGCDTAEMPGDCR